MKTAKKQIRGQLRQGDVLLHPVDELPAGAREVTPAGRIVLAEGEATGHAHAIRPEAGEAKLFAAGTGEIYLEVGAPIVLEHEEHSHLPVAPGVYQVRRQVEQWLDEVRQVAD